MGQHINRVCKYFLVIIWLPFFGCITRNLVGTYQPIKKYNIDRLSLTLNSDSTFIYNIRTELRGSAIFIGRWGLSKDTILLNIIQPINYDSILKKEKVISKKNNLINVNKNKIKVIIQDSIPFTLAKVFINENQIPVSLDSLGEAIVDTKINKITVKYQYIIPRTFLINSEFDNDFTLLIYDKAFIPSIYLMPILKWITKKGVLIPLNENNHPLTNDLYKK